MRGFGALLRFHRRSGATAALRLLVPWAALVVVALGLQQDPARTIDRLAASLAGLAGWIAVASACLAIAWWGAPYVTAADRGWLGHLPASSATRRAARVAAAVLMQAPILVAVVVLAAARVASGGAQPLLWLPAAALLAGLAALVSELRRPPARRPGLPLERLPVPFELRVFWRAAGPRLGEAALAGAIPIALASLFVHNNTLPAGLVRRGVTLGGGAAVASILATLAAVLVRRRPPWLWSRSLPIGSRRRVRADAVLLGAHALPACAVAALLDPVGGVVLLGALPLLALRASGAVRRPHAGRATGSQVLAEGAAVAVVLALVPWLAIVSLGLAPVALRAAAAQDAAWPA